MAENSDTVSMNGHHLILGTLKDYITGNDIEDTHDERYRQAIARFLVETKHYSKRDIRQGVSLTARTTGKAAILKIDFLVTLETKEMLMIKYGPGSIVTRHRPALSASRLLAPHQIPFVVVTNGIDGDILDGNTGKVLSNGLDTIPSKPELLKRSHNTPLLKISSKQVEMESKLLYAYEVDGSCPCDTTICKVNK